MRDKIRYNDLRSYIENDIKKFFAENKTLLGKKAELVMLLFDSLSCPYISEDTKQNLLSQHGINDPIAQNEIIDFQNKSGQPHLWFATWEKFNFGKELDTKHSQEVY